MSVARRVAFSGAHILQSVLRPFSQSRAKRSQNYLLPQFQTALGTIVHATPLVEALHKAEPDACIVVVSSGLAAQVWQGNRHLEGLITIPTPLKEPRSAIQAWRAAAIFDGQPHTTLLTTGNERTRITLAAALAAPSRRVGFAVHAELVHNHLRWDPALSQIENNLRLLAAAGLEDTSASTRKEPRIYPDAASVSFATALLAPMGGGLKIALATQTSITQRKKWRDNRWLELAQTLHERYAADLLFIGTEAEAPAIHALQQQLNFPTTSIAGKTTIPQLAAVLQQCDLGIMLDTGPLHVGRAVSLPTVVIAPAWSPAHEWLPVGNPRYRILKNADFPPPAPDTYIIDEVSVAEVLDAAASLVPNT